MSATGAIRVRVADAEFVTPEIRRLRLVDAGDGRLPEFSGGAHTLVSMQDGELLRCNPYSLMGSPYDTSSYQISVLRTAPSRGGSAFMHDHVQPGSELLISTPVNLFPLDRRARRHILIAGGIGITPFMAMMTQLDRESAPFELHYAMRSRDRGAYWGGLKSAYGHRVHTYFDDEQQALPLPRLLESQPLGTHLYVCGPSGMIDWVLAAARDAGWPDENVHHERFSAPPAGDPFTIELARSNAVVRVAAHQSMLEAIEAAGLQPQFLCRGGACGQCETTVLGCNGEIQHNDHYLTDDEKAAGKKIMLCVSRLAGTDGRIRIDL